MFSFTLTRYLCEVDGADDDGKCTLVNDTKSNPFSGLLLLLLTTKKMCRCATIVVGRRMANLFDGGIPS